MKYRYIFFLAILMTGLVTLGHGQVTNLSFNNTGTSFTITSGDTLRWEYNIPTGATTQVEFWLDVNQNGTIEPATDVIFATFDQADGDTNGNGGPPDMDGVVDGHVVFYQKLGLAPGKYIGKFTQNGSSAYANGTVTALSSPAHTVSGHVIPPAGESARYIFVELHRHDAYQPNFWDAITDSTGLYTVELNSDTAGNPWGLRVEHSPFPQAIITPQDTELIITGNHSGYDFTFVAAAAQVTGILKDDAGNPLVDRGVYVAPQNGSTSRRARTNGSGFFQIGLAASDLVGGSWYLQSETNGSITTTELTASASIPAINVSDSLFYILTAYSVNSQITGHITVNGGAPGFPMQVAATNVDSGSAYANADGSGNFTLPVSDKIYTYDLFAYNLPPDYSGPSVLAHPGESGVVISLITTSVVERDPGIPLHFGLSQNYPNPFNPSTRIDYDLAAASYVRLSVTNVLGQEVERLIDGEQQPGKYHTLFNVHGLPSGLYFYRLTAGPLVSVKKMILMR